MSSTKQIDGAAARGPEGDAHVLAALHGAEREAQRLECEARGLKDCLAARIEEGRTKLRAELDAGVRSAAEAARAREHSRADAELVRINEEKDEKLKVLRARFQAAREGYVERVFAIVTGQTVRSLVVSDALGLRDGVNAELGAVVTDEAALRHIDLFVEPWLLSSYRAHLLANSISCRQQKTRGAPRADMHREVSLLKRFVFMRPIGSAEPGGGRNPRLLTAVID